LVGTSIPTQNDTKETTSMVARKTALPLALLAGAALAVPGAAQAAGPTAHASGGDAPALNPAVVGNAITRTDAALNSAADFIDQGDGASAAKPLTAARRYLIRSYTGAKYLIAHPPAAPPAEEGSANPAASFKYRARLAVRSSHHGRKALSKYIKAHASDDGPAPPAIADNPTAVFNVLTSQYNAVTGAVAMYPDTTGALQAKVKLVLDTAIILRNRLVKAVAAAEPPAPAEEGRAHASGGAVVGTSYAPVMPGLTVLIDDEIQAMTAGQAALPAASQGDFSAAIAADQKVEAFVNTTWPPAPAD
jgi:hypothetical protein